jgi:hypothetical protein
LYITVGEKCPRAHCCVKTTARCESFDTHTTHTYLSHYFSFSCQSINKTMCKQTINSNTTHISPRISSIMNSNTQVNVEDTPLERQYQSASFSLSSSPTPQRKRSHTTLEDLHTGPKPSGLPCFPLLDECHLAADSPTILSFTLNKRRIILHTKLQDDIDDSSYYTPEQDIVCWNPFLGFNFDSNLSE